MQKRTELSVLIEVIFAGLGNIWGSVCSHEPGKQGISQPKSNQKLRLKRELILEEDGEEQKLSSWKRELCFLPISDKLFSFQNS